MRPRRTIQQGCTLKTVCGVPGARHPRPPSAWFYGLTSMTGNVQDREIYRDRKTAGVRGRGKGRGGAAKGVGLLPGDKKKKALELGTGEAEQSRECLKALTELDSVERVHGRYVDCMPIKKKKATTNLSVLGSQRRVFLKYVFID